jgi:ABC-2 type transport system ATP-binding protein
VKGLSWVKEIEVRNGSVDLSIDGAEERVPELIDFADNHKFVISSIELRKPSLEDAFLHYTGKTIREEEGSLKELWKAWMTRSRGRK